MPIEQYLCGTMTKLCTLSVLFLFLISASPVLGQQSFDSRQPERLFNEALKQYRNERYGVARSMFEELQQKFAPGQSNLKAEAAYYAAMSASKLENEDAEDMLRPF